MAAGYGHGRHPSKNRFSSSIPGFHRTLNWLQ
jgi:hypothetical protein